MQVMQLKSRPIRVKNGMVLQERQHGCPTTKTTRLKFRTSRFETLRICAHISVFEQ